MNHQYRSHQRRPRRPRGDSNSEDNNTNTNTDADPRGVPVSGNDLVEELAASTAAMSLNRRGMPASRFRIRDYGFFIVGKVLVITWVEPASQAHREASTFLHQSHSQIRDSVFSKNRHFVIIKTFRTHSLALAVGTHTGRALPARADPSQYGLIYTGQSVPNSDQTTINDSIQQQMLQPVRVLPDLVYESLDPRSTVNYGKLYTIEHNVPVAAFGVIYPEHRDILLQQAFDTLNLARGAAPAPANVAGATPQLSEQTQAYLSQIPHVMRNALAQSPNTSHADAFTTAVRALERQANQSDDPESRREALDTAAHMIGDRLQLTPPVLQQLDDQDEDGDDNDDDDE